MCGARVVGEQESRLAVLFYFFYYGRWVKCPTPTLRACVRAEGDNAAVVSVRIRVRVCRQDRLLGTTTVA